MDFAQLYSIAVMFIFCRIKNTRDWKYQRVCCRPGQSIVTSFSWMEILQLQELFFVPAGLTTLFNMPVYQYTEERIDLRKILMPFVVEKYAASLAASTEPLQKARLLEDFVLKFYEANKPEPDYIDEAANKIVDSLYGLLNVNELMENIYMSSPEFLKERF